ncbi:MAG: hypothetical protein KBT75_08635 [Oleispira antarctica]|nr:hypothetical protein [Oleispira antarctica]MBQ0791680.1 hypothetical protein [Oleispira antarctica]|tara:strand:+ start:468 stop:623 length:156 start_codon:yes stop_codon:yes gene_type:complete
MSALELQSAMSDTLLHLVLAQRAQVKKQREQLAEQKSAHAVSSSRVYAKAA